MLWMSSLEEAKEKFIDGWMEGGVEEASKWARSRDR